jgi:hypothetical protein
MSRSLLAQGSRHLPPRLILSVRQKKMIRLCFHCSRKVLSRSTDGACPGCGRTDGLSDIAIPEDQTEVAVLSGSRRLPDICIFCGDPAFDRQNVRWSRPSPHAPVRSAGFGTKWFIFKIFESIVGFRDQSIELDIPRCRSCSATSPDVEQILWDDYKVTIRCHRKFCSEIKRNEE